MQKGETEVCKELLGRNDNRSESRPPVVLENYRYLPSSQKLMGGWLRRSISENTKNPFEKFIFAWISLNGWASCVTGVERDRWWLNGLMLDADLNESFNRLRSENEEFHLKVEQLFALLPVFKVQDLRQRGVIHSSNEHRSRPELINYYLEEGSKEYSPLCFESHCSRSEGLPRDLPHALSALYRIRCNLFHGEKSLYSENDLEIVAAGHAVLSSYLVLTGLILSPGSQKVRRKV